VKRERDQSAQTAAEGSVESTRGRVVVSCVDVIIILHSKAWLPRERLILK